MTRSAAASHRHGSLRGVRPRVGAQVCAGTMQAVERERTALPHPTPATAVGTSPEVACRHLVCVDSGRSLQRAEVGPLPVGPAGSPAGGAGRLGEGLGTAGRSVARLPLGPANAALTVPSRPCLLKYERTAAAVCAVDSCVDTLLGLLRMYREKPGDRVADKSGSIFTRTCCLLAVLLKATGRASVS